MHPLLFTALESIVESAISVAVESAFRSPAQPAPPPRSDDPVQEAANVMDSFLRAIADRDWNAIPRLCEAGWAMRPETAELMDHTLASARPISWAFEEVLVPDVWVPGEWLPWLVAELAVTFDLEDRYEVVPAGMRAVPTDAGWQIDHLQWGSAAEPEPETFQNPFPEWVTLPIAEFTTTEIIVCASCAQRLSVPCDKGRLRVTCRTCGNRQWYPA